MFDPATLKAIGDAGGWVILVVVLTVGFGYLFRAVSSGEVVSGKLYDRTLISQDKTVEALGKLTSSMEALGTQVAVSIRELREDVNELRRRPDWRRD